MSLHPYRDISQLTKKDIPQSQVGIIGQGGLIQNGGKDLPILSQQINSKPLYDYNKNRTDAAQLPLNFFIRNHQKSENRLSFVPHIDHSLEI